MKEFEKYTRNGHEKYIPEYWARFRKSIGYHERQYRKHHDSSPPAELTWIECISTIEPSPSEVFVGRVSEVGEIERTRNGKNSLNDDARDKPVMISPKASIDRKSLKSIVEYKENYDDIFSWNIE